MKHIRSIRCGLYQIFTLTDDKPEKATAPNTVKHS